MKIEVTEQEAKLFAEAMEQIDKISTFLARLTHEERLDWLRAHQYPHPISFEREIGGTVYTVNAYFNKEKVETVEGKVERILAKK